MLAPLLVVWPISIALTHYFANSVASFPYDQSLRAHVLAIAKQVSFEEQEARVNLSISANALLRSDEVDNVYFRVQTRHGRFLAGDRGLPQQNLQAPAPLVGEVYYRDSEYRGQDIRMAYGFWADEKNPEHPRVLIEVAETLEKRSQLANKIIASVIVPQFIIIPLAILLVWFGLTKGLQPLTRLREAIEQRGTGDLSPIGTQRVPEELSPLIDAFNNMLLRMQQNLEAQRRFIADAAHQMRTPLTGLKTQAELALRETNPQQLHGSLTQIATGVNRASRLINQLLTLARAEGGDHSQHKQEALDLNRLLREIVEHWVTRAVDKGIDLGFEPSSRAALIGGNDFLLQEMTYNLIDNALRYTPAGGAVTVRVIVHEDFVILEVEDNGLGLSDDQAERVFDRFYRVGESEAEGSGLGLSIVREIATLHRASVSLRANPHERGTVARVVFPAWYSQSLSS